MTCGGVERYGGKPLWCAFAAGPLEGLDHALALSCNVAFANLGTRLGNRAHGGGVPPWGFDAGGGALLGAAGRVHTPPRTPRQLADLSVGLELADVTPLHAALLAAVVANDGRMPEPRLRDRRLRGARPARRAAPPVGRAGRARARRSPDASVAPWRPSPRTAPARGSRPGLSHRHEDGHGGGVGPRLPRQLHRRGTPAGPDGGLLRPRHERALVAGGQPRRARGHTPPARGPGRPPPGPRPAPGRTARCSFTPPGPGGP